MTMVVILINCLCTQSGHVVLNQIANDYDVSMMCLCTEWACEVNFRPAQV